MKKLISLCLAMTMLLGSMVGCGKTPTSSSGNPSNSEGGGLGTPQTFKFGLTVASTHPYSIAAQNFAELVEEKSGGNMTVDLYYDSSLGDDAALMESMQMNAVTFALVGPAGIAPMCPIYEFFDLPCLFATRDAAYAFQESEPVLELMDSLSANGLRGLGFYENGYYAISNNAKEITTVDGLNNLKLRSMTSEMAIKSWECLNVQPVAMAFGELFMAMQTGTVDGQETTIGSFYTSKFYEVQKYVIDTNHVYEWVAIFISEKTYQSLPKDLQDILSTYAVTSFGDYCTELNQETSDAFLQELLDNGMERIEPDQDAFREKALASYDKWFADEWTVTNYEEVMSYAK